MRIFTFASPRCGKSSKTPRARSGSMRCEIALWRSDGPWTESSPSTVTWANPVLLLWTEKVSSDWSRKRAWVKPALYWDWRSPAWLATQQTGIGSWICALTDTLILDEDGVYDPAHFNDRLLLGLKGTMSEAELHVLRARLQGGILNKARRGELRSPLPVGFAYDAEDRVILDPDQQVQQTIRFLFDTFHRTGSACAVVKAFRQQALLFPRRLKKGPHKGELLWAEMEHSQVLRVLHNPRYAGAFIYGRTRTRKKPDGKESWSKLPREQWLLVPGMHAGYIAWEEYEANQRRLQENAQAHGADRRLSSPHQGPALLQGIVICGICGGRMGVRYHDREKRLVPDYVCQRKAIQQGRPVCQRITGEHVDKAVSDVLVQTMTPLALEVALTVQQELQSRLALPDQGRTRLSFAFGESAVPCSAIYTCVGSCSAGRSGDTRSV